MISKPHELMSSDRIPSSFGCFKANLQSFNFNDTFYISSDISTVEHIQVLE
jgi:hypothetical protein